MVIFHSYVSLPEGIMYIRAYQCQASFNPSAISSPCPKAKKHSEDWTTLYYDKQYDKQKQFKKNSTIHQVLCWVVSYTLNPRQVWWSWSPTTFTAIPVNHQYHQSEAYLASKIIIHESMITLDHPWFELVDWWAPIFLMTGPWFILLLW